MRDSTIKCHVAGHNSHAVQHFDISNASLSSSNLTLNLRSSGFDAFNFRISIGHQHAGASWTTAAVHFESKELIMTADEPKWK